MKRPIFGLTLLWSCACSAYANQIEAMGDAIQWALPISAMTMTIWDEDPEGRTMFYKSFGATAAVTYSVKLSVNRTRPNGAHYSFPSGHTSASFSSAAYIHKRYGLEKGSFAYLGALFVGWSRVQAQKHYATDVLAGAAVGMLSSFLFTSNDNIGIGVHKDGDSSGIDININW